MEPKQFLIETLPTLRRDELQIIGEAAKTMLGYPIGGKEDIVFNDTWKLIDDEWHPSDIVHFINEVFDRCNDIAVHDVYTFFLTAITMTICSRDYMKTK